MSTLMRLPNELLLAILRISSTVENAASLSRVNQRLYAVWLENTDQIVQTILRSFVQAYDDALALAVAQASSPENPQPLPRLWLPLLRHNADLAASAETQFHKFVDKMPEGHYRHQLSTSSFPIPYYLIRRLVLSHIRPQLQSSMQAELDLIPSHIIDIAYELIRVLKECIYEDGEERRRHGIEKDRRLWTAEEKMEGDANADEWEYAAEKLWETLYARHLIPDT